MQLLKNLSWFCTTGQQDICCYTNFTYGGRFFHWITFPQTLFYINPDSSLHKKKLNPCTNHEQHGAEALYDNSRKSWTWKMLTKGMQCAVTNRWYPFQTRTLQRSWPTRSYFQYRNSFSIIKMERMHYHILPVSTSFTF